MKTKEELNLEPLIKLLTNGDDPDSLVEKLDVALRYIISSELFHPEPYHLNIYDAVANVRNAIRDTTKNKRN